MAYIKAVGKNQVVCSRCGSPARIETVVDERVGVEHFEFCTNQNCMNYDVQGEQEQIQKIQNTPVYRRFIKRLWKSAIWNFKHYGRL